jgi:hypothetical protein
VAPVLKSRFENLELELSIDVRNLNEQSPVSICRHFEVLTTQGHDKRTVTLKDVYLGSSRCFGRWMGGLGSAWCRGFGGLDWGMARVRKPLSATPLTTRVEGKCKEITSDRSEWGQVPTPLNEFAWSFRRQPSSKRDAGIFLSHLEALGIRYALFFIFRHSHSLTPLTDTRFRSFLLIIAQNCNYSLLLLDE